jgi:sulfate permease, SulP family
VALGDIDFTGAQALGTVLDELQDSNVAMAVARAVAGAPENLARSGLLERIGRDHLFPSVDEAVVALGPQTPGPGTAEPGIQGPSATTPGG